MARNTEPQTDPGQQQQTQADPEGDRITTIADLKTEQDRQAGVLDELLGLVKGGKTTQPTAPAQGTPSEIRPGDHLDEIKKAIRDVRAEDADAERQAAHDLEHARLRDGATKPKEPEQTPREAMVRGKQRLQRIMFGADQ